MRDINPQSLQDTQVLTDRIRAEDAAKKLLKDNKLEPGEPILAPKDAPYSEGNPIEIETNYFKFKLDKETTVYQYHVLIAFKWTKDTGEKKEWQMTESDKKQFAMKADNERKVQDVFDFLHQHFADRLPPRSRMYFDGCYMLYSLDKLTEGRDALKLEVNQSQISEQLRQLCFSATTLEMTITPTPEEVRMMVPPDPSSVTLEQAFESRHFLQFLDTVFHEHQRQSQVHVSYNNGICYLIDPMAHGYNPQQLQVYDFGLYLAYGAKISVRMIGDSVKEASLALVVSPRCTPFNSTFTVADLILHRYPNFAEMGNGALNEAAFFFTGLYFLPVHRPKTSQLCKIDGISTTNAIQQTFSRKDGQVISIADYFQQHYNVALKYPKLQLLVVVKRGQQTYVPMEMAMLVDHQPATTNQLTEDIQSRVLRIATRTPIQCKEEVMCQMRALQLNNSSVLGSAGIHVEEKPITVKGHSIPAPVMVYQSGSKPSTFNDVKGNWSTASKYILPASSGQWAIFAMESGRSKKINDQGLQTFVNKFVNACRFKGMQMDMPKVVQVVNTRPNNTHSIPELEELMQSSAQHKFKFVMLLTTLEDGLIHPTLKKYEQAYGVVTQNVTSKNVLAAAGINGPEKRLTMENIVNKTNMKLGGVNYGVGDLQTNKFICEEDLVIGLATNHPVARAGPSNAVNAPSVVGFAGNYLPVQSAFAGDYLFQDGKRIEKFGIIQEVVEYCVKMYTDNRKKEPARVFILSSDCTDSQFGQILRYEVPLIEKSLKSHAPQAKLVILALTKMHPTKFFPKGINEGMNAMAQNVKSGTLIDSGVVSPNFNEFYLMSHVGRLGTAKIPRYTIIYNPGKIPTKDIKFLCHKLCFAHQIVNLPTSIPSPCYIAEELAKRGRNIYFAHTASINGNGLNGHGSNERDSPTENGQSISPSSGSDGSIQFGHENATYTYRKVVLQADGSSFGSFRFNA